MLVPNKSIKFYDTSTLLKYYNNIFTQDEKFLISSVTISELEDIKNSKNKSESIKCAARALSRLLVQYQDKYDVVIYTTDKSEPIFGFQLPDNNDTKILACARWYNDYVQIDNILFITNDISMYNMARLIYLNSQLLLTSKNDMEEYTGYKEIYPTYEQQVELYQNPHNNIFEALNNEYVILKNENGEIQDVRVWRDGGYKYLAEPIFKSDLFGKVTPYNNDIYQKCVFDSLINNQITMIRGCAGSGKTLISFSCLLHKLEKHEIDKVIIFCNPLATLNSAKLGYTPGSLNEKLLDTQIGNILSSKLGDRYIVEQMINENKLVLLPFSNIRGFDATGTRAGIYITEAQNLDKELMKLALQRVGEDCVCIVEGDSNTQVDLPQFAGDNNGMRRLSEIFRGKKMYGEVTLKKYIQEQNCCYC